MRYVISKWLLTIFMVTCLTRAVFAGNEDALTPPAPIASETSVIITPCLFYHSGLLRSTWSPITLQYATNFLSLSTSSSLSDRYTTPHAKIEAPENPSDLKQKIDFSELLRSRVDTPNLDYWNMVANTRPPTIRYKYDGLHGVIYNRIISLLDRQFMRQMKILWSNSSLHPLDLSRKQQEFYLARNSDMWWQNRDWLDYLPSEKGGERVEIRTIGRRFDIVSFGPLRISNTGKFSLKDWDLSFKRDPIEVDPLNPSSGIINEADVASFGKQKERLYLGITPPKGNILTTGSWSLSGDLNINIRPTWNIDGQSWGKNRSSITGGLEWKFYDSPNKLPWLIAELRVTAKPLREEYSAELAIAFVRW